MPSHAKEKHSKLKPKPKSKHPGGPFRRKDDEWNTNIGLSINEIPGSKLPQIGTILQRYRALRIEFPLANETTIAQMILAEVQPIWDRARIPTTSNHNCVKRIKGAISIWKACHNPGELGAVLQGKLNALLDLAQKPKGKNVSEEVQLQYLRDLMRHNSLREKRKAETEDLTYETDFKFYLDQKVQIIFLKYFIEHFYRSILFKYRLEVAVGIWRIVNHIVACHLPRGSKLRWREVMGGGLPNALGVAHTRFT